MATTEQSAGKRLAEPVEVREHLVEVLRRDLVGADPHEVLSVAPSRWYLTGFLVPREAPVEVRQDPEPDEELASGGDDDGDDGAPAEVASARKAFFPSSIGLSVLVPAGTRTLSARATWGEYVREEGSVRPPPEGAEGEAPAAARPEERWRRSPREAARTVEIPASGKVTYSLAEGIDLVISVRRVPEKAGVKEKGARAVSAFLVNDQEMEPGRAKDQVFLFQAALELHTDAHFVPRPNVRGQGGDDADEQIAELQYRDVFEYAVGHGVAAEADVVEGQACTRVRTTWMPGAEVERVEPGRVEGVELGMEALAAAGSAAEIRGLLKELPAAYAAWIEAQAQTKVERLQGEVLAGLLDAARTVERRMVDGLAALDDEKVFEAFRLANRAMARAARARDTEKKQGAPRWRPFQLAFLLLNLRAMHEPTHHDRAVIDLLFFPTGGGKTEAYLGLAAFTLVLRRLRSEGVGGAGVSVVMRYTLRLLTLDQLGRAAALVCALELERQERAKQGDTRLGAWPFEIGLWVGKGATPNRMGGEKDFDPSTARMKVLAYQQASDRNPTPVPVEKCPWCDRKFSPGSFRLTPSQARPQNLEVYCTNRDCAFAGERALPMLTVDEPIYRRLPCFLIATVDKFAQLPWVGRTGALFGKVDRHDKAGFYGPCDPGIGRPIEGGQLAPPDLVIQDELHLISGPLGTMVGLYETAIDVLCEGRAEGKAFGPKIIASTATVRRAEAQIKALFGRSAVTIFPPPGPDRRDSFFARTVPSTERHARRYLGVAAPGRSMKVALLRVYLALLAAGKKAHDDAGMAADAYTTLVGYFNSLRELGGSRRIVEDEVTSRVRGYDSRRRVGEARGDFVMRSIGEPVELTSREPTHRVAKAKDRLKCTVAEADRVDVALATNMISVGLDIQRLGLMVVLGQPKTTAEYIQATSRVGRDAERPGLVVTLLNCHKPRDRSHYERFSAYHASFYRAVEATSVTPFSPRAIDRGIAAVTVALARLGIAELTPPRGAEEIVKGALGERVSGLPKRLGARAEQAHVGSDEAPEIGRRVEKRTRDLLDSWKRAVEKNHAVSAGLQYQREEPEHPKLLRDPLEAPPDDRDLLKFKAQRSLRDVEPSVDVYLRKPGGRRQEDG
ncbi:MAG TPA: DISARM system helicase DrmA [Candidatus Nanopelagicales bacterium]|nr:DISARM system helicase DrmA [Candidatus Nanopelagicales bacterium]